MMKWIYRKDYRNLLRAKGNRARWRIFGSRIIVKDSLFAVMEIGTDGMSKG